MMIKQVKEIASQLSTILKEGNWNEQEVVEKTLRFHRLWTEWGEKGARVWLHHHPAAGTGTGLWHPHSWPMAVLMLGPANYELGLGFGPWVDDLHGTDRDVLPAVHSRVVAGPGFAYQMIVKEAWHYVRPRGECYSIMATAPGWDRPIKSVENDAIEPLSAAVVDELQQLVAGEFERRR